MKSLVNPCSVDELHALFVLHEDGALTKKTYSGNRAAGQSVGWTNGAGYKSVQINGKSVSQHRVVYAMFNGKWPENIIDHIDGCKTNNRPCNLRDVSPSYNMQNSDKRKGYCLVRGKYRVVIKTGGKGRVVGYYATEDEARSAYIAAKKELHEGYVK